LDAEPLCGFLLQKERPSRNRGWAFSELYFYFSWPKENVRQELEGRIDRA